MRKIKNPIQKGFYPDPSICRVGDNYYMVHSTFAYAPGIPVFKSSDLKKWVLIGHALERNEQLCLTGARISEGIYAPSIKYHNGIFYITATNVSGGGNFYVMAPDPKGPWSDPVFLENAPGIDPSLFFEDGICYYIGQRTKKKAEYEGDCEIWIQKLDLEKKELVDKPVSLYDGSMKQTIWAEGPHMYYIDQMYYLLVAEGGTEFNHSVSVARSRTLFGPYEACPHNPVLTHRHLGHNFPVQNIGHGDLFDTTTGDWFMVMLGTRPLNGCAELGRETFLANVIWEEGWPVVSPGAGRVLEYLEVSGFDNEEEEEAYNGVISWSNPFDSRFLGLRDNPSKLPVKVEEGRLYLPFLPYTIEELSVPVYIGTRILSRTFDVRVMMETEPEGKEESGLLYLYDETHYVKSVIHKEGDEFKVVTVIKNGEALKEWKSRTVSDKFHELHWQGHDQKMTVKVNGVTMVESLDIKDLCSEKAGGFTGCTMGVYASSVHETSDHCAVFGPLTIRFGD